MQYVQQKSRSQKGSTSYRPTSRGWVRAACLYCNLYTRRRNMNLSSPGNSGFLSRQWWWPVGQTRQWTCNYLTYTHIDSVWSCWWHWLDSLFRRTSRQVNLNPSNVEVQVTPFIHIPLHPIILFSVTQNFINSTLEWPTSHKSVISKMPDGLIFTTFSFFWTWLY